MAIRKIATLATKVQPRSLLSILSAFLFGAPKHGHIRHLPLLLYHPSLEHAPPPPPRIPENVPAEQILQKIRLLEATSVPHLLEGLAMGYETEAEFKSRYEMASGQYGKMLVLASIPRIREIGAVLCNVLGKPRAMLSVNMPFCTRPEFSQALISGFPVINSGPGSPELVAQYIRPYMELEDVMAHLPPPKSSAASSASSCANELDPRISQDVVADTRQDLSAEIHRLTLNTAINAIMAVKLARDRYGYRSPVPPEVLMRNVQFLLRVLCFDHIPDNLMARADCSLQQLADEIAKKYDRRAGAPYRAAADAWGTSLMKRKEERDLATLKRKLLKLGFVTADQLTGPALKKNAEKFTLSPS